MSGTLDGRSRAVEKYPGVPQRHRGFFFLLPPAQIPIFHIVHRLITTIYSYISIDIRKKGTHMRFTVSQPALSEALATVMKGVANASTLPILSGVLIRATDGVLEFQTSNYTISIRHRIAARVEEEGEMVVPCKMLSNITKTLPDAPVSFEVAERQVSITCEKSSFRLNTLDACDFPEFPAFALESSVELPANILTEMVGRVWRVTSTDKNRPVLNGVYMTVENNTVRLVATDSYRLAVCDTQVETSSLEGSFELNVPAEAFNDALSITGGQGMIMIGSTDTQVVFVAGNTTYVSRRIEGVYPNYKALLPASCATKVKIDVEAFSAALKRVAAHRAGELGGQVRRSTLRRASWGSPRLQRPGPRERDRRRRGRGRVRRHRVQLPLHLRVPERHLPREGDNARAAVLQPGGHLQVLRQDQLPVSRHARPHLAPLACPSPPAPSRCATSVATPTTSWSSPRAPRCSSVRTPRGRPTSWRPCSSAAQPLRSAAPRRPTWSGRGSTDVPSNSRSRARGACSSWGSRWTAASARSCATGSAAEPRPSAACSRASCSAPTTSTW